MIIVIKANDQYIGAVSLALTSMFFHAKNAHHVCMGHHYPASLETRPRVSSNTPRKFVSYDNAYVFPVHSPVSKLQVFHIQSDEHEDDT
jgi:hypothetical protein